MKTDVVVIGGGVAGLATAALLAQSGRSVAVLEKGNALGGRAYTYEKEGFVLNYGPHAMYGPYSGLLRQVLKRLGRQPIPHGLPPPTRAYFAFDGRFGRLGPLPHHVLTARCLPPPSRLRLLPLMLALRLARPERWLAVTWRQWLERRTRDRRLIRFAEALATLNTYCRPSAGLSADMILRHFQRHLFSRDYVGYMSGGWATMYDLFAEVVKEKGGLVQTGAQVERLEVAGGRVTAALTARERFEAAAFVCTLPPQEAPALADDGSALKGELEGWSGLRDVRGLCLDLGFRRRLRTDLYFIYDVDHDLYYSLHSEVTPDLAPPGGQLLHAFVYLSPEEAADNALLEERRRQLEEGLDRHFPGWRQEIVVERAVPNVRVACARPEPSQLGAARVPLRAASVDNLYFAGDGRDLPYNLTEICLGSAVEVADAIPAGAGAQQPDSIAAQLGAA